MSAMNSPWVTSYLLSKKSCVSVTGYLMRWKVPALMKTMLVSGTKPAVERCAEASEVAPDWVGAPLSQPVWHIIIRNQIRTAQHGNSPQQRVREERETGRQWSGIWCLCFTDGYDRLQACTMQAGRLQPRPAKRRLYVCISKRSC